MQDSFFFLPSPFPGRGSVWKKMQHVEGRVKEAQVCSVRFEIQKAVPVVTKSSGTCGKDWLVFLDEDRENTLLYLEMAKVTFLGTRS